MTDNLSLEKFSPTIAELQKLVEETKGVTVSDFTNKAQLKLVKDSRLKLRDARLSITKAGKAIREDALKFQKAVVAKEKELVGIIEPEEERLGALEDRAEKEREVNDRKELLPRRRERLVAADPQINVTDESLLELDGAQFESFLNEVVAAKNERDRQALDVKRKEDDAKAEEERRKLAEGQAKLEAEKAEVQHKKDLAEAEERGRKEAADKKEREDKEAKDKTERDRVAAEATAKTEKEVRERDQRYQEFLKKNNVPSDLMDVSMLGGEFYVVKVAGAIILYKKIDELSL